MKLISGKGEVLENRARLSCLQWNKKSIFYIPKQVIFYDDAKFIADIIGRCRMKSYEGETDVNNNIQFKKYEGGKFFIEGWCDVSGLKMIYRTLEDEKKD